MHTAVGNDINEQMIVNRIDDYLQYDSCQTLIIIY